MGNLWDTIDSFGTKAMRWWENFSTFKWFENFMYPVKNFIVENARNVFLWVGIIAVALITFELVYKALKKEK